MLLAAAAVKTYIHTCIATWVHTNMHAQVHTCIQTFKHRHTHTNISIQSAIHKHTHAHTYTDPVIHLYIHRAIYTKIQWILLINTHTHHTCPYKCHIDTYNISSHTYTYIHPCTPNRSIKNYKLKTETNLIIASEFLLNNLCWIWFGFICLTFVIAKNTVTTATAAATSGISSSNNGSSPFLMGGQRWDKVRRVIEREF